VIPLDLQRNVPLRDEIGKIVKWYGTGIDIEERKRAEESLRSSEAYLAEAQKAQPDGQLGMESRPGYQVLVGGMLPFLSFDPQDGLPRFEEFFQRIHPTTNPA